MTRREYLVLYETAEDGSVSTHVPDLPIILAAGSNQDEARQSVREAIEAYLEDLNETGQPVPEPSVAYEFVAYPHKTGPRRLYLATTSMATGALRGG